MAHKGSQLEPEPVMGVNILFAAILFLLLCVTAVVMSFLHVYEELRQTSITVRESVTDFKMKTDEAWRSVIELSTNLEKANGNRRVTRRDGFLESTTGRLLVNKFFSLPGWCQCEPVVPRCPRGPPGPPGKTGPRGEPGAHGKRGRNNYESLPGRACRFESVCLQCPAGPPGPIGEVGPWGRPGSPGNEGIPARDSLKFVRGPPGPVGGQGLPGREGQRGVPGEPGRNGLVSFQSRRLQGPSGERGRPGVGGERGRPGDDGVPGAMGPLGRAGLPGRLGMPGKLGFPGRPGLEGRDGGYCSCPSRTVILSKQ